MPLTLTQAAQAIRAGEKTPSDLVEASLKQAELYRDLNAMALLDSAGARRAAEAMSAEAKRGEFRGPLHGVPVTIKDLFNVRGMPARGSTAAKLPDLGMEEATCVARLRAAGAIILGKTHLHEIALGVTGQNAYTGDVKNPHDPARMTGGSSSGAAAATVAGIGHFGLGSDTGGSIRIPSALCGLTGFKGSHGAVPLDGTLALSATCDHGGPLAHTVADCRLAFEILSGQILPPESAPHPADLTFCVPRKHLAGWLGPETRRAFEAFLKRISGSGARVVDVDPADLDLADAAYTPLVRAEAAHVHRATLSTRPDDFTPPVRDPLLIGRGLSADAYLEARALRRRVRAGLAAAFQGVDAMLLPATPVHAPLRDTTELDLESGRVNLRAAFIHLTAPFSMAGIPITCLPYARVGNMPIGLQVLCPAAADRRALDLGAWVERVTGFGQD